MRIHNQPRHQRLVGHTFTQDGCKVVCLAAHNDAVLVLRHDTEGEPANYIICHCPEVSNGQIRWGFGDYFTISNYQNLGRAAPLSDAFADAVANLLNTQIVAFHFDALDEETEPFQILVRISQPLTYDQIDEIIDCFAAYTESMPVYTYQQCVEDVLKSFPQFSYTLLQPEHTFEI